MSDRRESRKAGSDTRYTYAVGRIRALEARLLSPGDMDRLLDEETQDDVLKELGEFADYAEVFSSGEKEPEKILEAQVTRAYNVISSLSLGSRVITTLRLKYDFHNLKILLKARALRLGPRGLSEVGFYSRQELEQVIDGASLGPGDDAFPLQAVSSGVQTVPDDASPEQIETILNKFYYRLFLRNLSVNPFVAEYARRTIDLVNLRTFWRVQLAEWPEEKLAAHLLPGGTMPPSFFVTELATPLADLMPRIPDGSYRRILQEALGGFQSKGDLSLLDKLADDFLVEFLRRAKHYCFGLEPLVGYIAAKENEVARLRAIIYGKERGLPTNMMRELGRMSYV